MIEVKEMRAERKQRWESKQREVEKGATAAEREVREIRRKKEGPKSQRDERT